MRFILKLFLLIASIFYINSCGTVKYDNLYSQSDYTKIEKFKNMLIAIGGDRNEAKELATLAVIKSKELANSYNLVSPPLYHNFLVNSGKRNRGLCYHFVEDLYQEIKSRHFRSFKFKWGRANQNRLNEHNVIVVLAKNAPWSEGVILDAWRNSGRLFFTKVKDDKEYKFIEWEEGNKRFK